MGKDKNFLNSLSHQLTHLEAGGKRRQSQDLPIPFGILYLFSLACMPKNSTHNWSVLIGDNHTRLCQPHISVKTFIDIHQVLVQETLRLPHRLSLSLSTVLQVLPTFWIHLLISCILEPAFISELIVILCIC